MSSEEEVRVKGVQRYVLQGVNSRSIFSNYVAKLGVLYWYSKKEGRGCCNGPNVKVECAIHI